MASEHEKFHAMLKRFDTAMLATHKAGARFHVRPMQMVEIEPTCTVWFFTSRESPKVFELGDDDRVSIICQDDDSFLTITGVASVIDDKARIEELWDERYRTWFPQGKDDPSLVLISVSPLDGEYWDNKGVKGVRYAFEAAKAFVKNIATSDKTRPQIGRDIHGKADLR